MFWFGIKLFTLLILCVFQDVITLVLFVILVLGSIIIAVISWHFLDHYWAWVGVPAIAIHIAVFGYILYLAQKDWIPAPPPSKDNLASTTES